MKTEDIFIDDNLFDDTDQNNIKKISEDVLQHTNIDQSEPLFVNLPEEWAEKVKITPDQDDVPFVDLPEEKLKKLKKNYLKLPQMHIRGSFN